MQLYINDKTRRGYGFYSNSSLTEMCRAHAPLTINRSNPCVSVDLMMFSKWRLVYLTFLRIFPKPAPWNSQSRPQGRGVHASLRKAFYPLSSGTLEIAGKHLFKSVHVKRRHGDCSETISFLSTSSRSQRWSWTAAYRSSGSLPQCTSTCWPRIHLSLTQDTFLMALLGLPRWRSVSKRATRDLCKDTASKSQPAHSDPLTEPKRSAAEIRHWTTSCSHVSTVTTDVLYVQCEEKTEPLHSACFIISPVRFKYTTSSHLK